MKNIFYNIFSVGVNINHKIIFPLLFLIFILSVSSVSAELLNDGDSFDLMGNDEFSNFNEDMEIENNNDIEDNLLSDVPSEFREDDLLNGADVGIVEDNLLDGADDSILEDGADNGEGSDDEGTDDEIDDSPKNTSLMIISHDNWKIYGVKNYTVKLLDEDKNPIENAKIKFKITTPKGKYIYRNAITDERGIAVLALNLTLNGIYNIQVSYYGNSDFNPADSVNSTVMLYERTIIKTSTYSYRSNNLTIRLYSLKTNKTLANKKLIVYVGKTRYYRTTDSQGRVFVKMPSDKKLIKLNCTFAASDFYEESKRIMDLPVYKKTYMKPLVYAMIKGKYFKILLKGTDGKILKKEKVKLTINGKTFTKTTNDKGIAYLKIALQRGEYEVSFAYGNNSIYGPSKNSSIVHVLDPSGQYKQGLNQNTKLSVYKYLSGGGCARVTKAIRNLSKKITGKHATKLEKAAAIFNYVRDNLDYEYYANSRKGASKTLKTKAGNCCDHANLIVALCRASKIPARYSHAQGCRFTRSGKVEGHVWAQIYVGGKWYSADGTSYRNSLGHIKNWDTKSYNRLHIYRNIPF